MAQCCSSDSSFRDIFVKSKVCSIKIDSEVTVPICPFLIGTGGIRMSVPVNELFYPGFIDQIPVANDKQIFHGWRCHPSSTGTSSFFSNGKRPFQVLGQTQCFVFQRSQGASGISLKTREEDGEFASCSQKRRICQSYVRNVWTQEDWKCGQSNRVQWCSGLN